MAEDLRKYIDYLTILADIYENKVSKENQTVLSFEEYKSLVLGRRG